MKKIRDTVIFGILSAMSSPVFAATGERVDDSHLLTYIFLSVCGLIILFQLVPVVSVVKSLLRKAAARQVESNMEKLKTADSKYR